MLKELVARNRSYRRFYQNERISEETLKEFVDLARMAGSTANSAQMFYARKTGAAFSKEMARSVRVALKDWDGPEEGERPAAYIVILCDQSIAKNKMWDEGIAAQTILLGAAEQGFGGCMIGSINRSRLADVLRLDEERYSIGLVLALGKPKEQVVVVPIGEDGSTAYYRDENQVHYVPKRSLEDIIVS